MEWQDRGLVLSTRRHGERNSILEVMTESHGRHLGLVRGGRSPRHSSTLQPGNRVALTWRARLEDHLGAFLAETQESRAAFIINDALALHAVGHLAQLVRLLPERSPHPEIYEAADALCALAGDAGLLAPMLVRFELLILAELGFGLDLEACAATGQREDLAYVSPKSGRAVSREAGAPWAPKLLPLPAFLTDAVSSRPDADAYRSLAPKEIADAFRLAGYFLERHVFEPRGIAGSQSRETFITQFLARASIV